MSSCGIFRGLLRPAHAAHLLRGVPLAFWYDFFKWERLARILRYTCSAFVDFSGGFIFV